MHCHVHDRWCERRVVWLGWHMSRTLCRCGDGAGETPDELARAQVCEVGCRLACVWGMNSCPFVPLPMPCRSIANAMS